MVGKFGRKNCKEKKVDYLVVSHMEPDHAFNIEMISKKYPEMKIVGNEKNIYIYKAIFQYRKFRRKKNCSKRGRHIKFRKTYITIFLWHQWYIGQK